MLFEAGCMCQHTIYHKRDLGMWLAVMYQNFCKHHGQCMLRVMFSSSKVSSVGLSKTSSAQH